MSNKHPPSSLEKEFELERMILFSDAVFAIAITLLIIDIKFPELPEQLVGVNKLKLFWHTIASFIAFAFSFFFIGLSWSVHLALFRLLRKYDQGLINRNLLFLFFIVTFPFTASAVAGHLRANFYFPLYLYMGNLAMVSIAHFILCRYIIRQRPSLTVEGKEKEKKYFYIRSKYNAIVLGSIVLLLIAFGAVMPGQSLYFTVTGLLTSFLMVLARKKANKYKPVGSEVG